MPTPKSHANPKRRLKGRSKGKVVWLGARRELTPDEMKQAATTPGQLNLTLNLDGETWEESFRVPGGMTAADVEDMGEALAAFVDDLTKRSARSILLLGVNPQGVGVTADSIDGRDVNALIGVMEQIKLELLSE